MSTYLRDVKNNALLYNAIGPIKATQTITGSALDMLQGDGRCFATLSMGIFNATAMTVTIQQSAQTNANFTDVAAFAAQTTTNATPLTITFDRDQRYLRAIATVSGTTIDCGVLVGEQLKEL